MYRNENSIVDLSLSQFILEHLSIQPAMVSVVRGCDPPVGGMYCHPRAQRLGKDPAVRHCPSNTGQGKGWSCLARAKEGDGLLFGS